MPGRGLDAGFMNAAFVWNPILGRTIHYSTFGAGAAVLAGGYPVVTLTVYDTNDASTTSVFDDLFDNGAIIYPTVSLPTKFFGMPGHQSVWGAYSSGRYDVLDPQSLTDLPAAGARTSPDDSRPRFLVDHLPVRPGAVGRPHGSNAQLGRVRQCRDQRWQAEPDPLVRHRWHRREQPDPQPQTGHLRHRVLLPGVERRLQE